MAERFTALQDFHSEETQSDYVHGLGYTLDDGNEKLAALVKRWLAEGKVELGGSAAKVTGTGG